MLKTKVSEFLDQIMFSLDSFNFLFISICLSGRTASEIRSFLDKIKKENSIYLIHIVFKC